MKITRDKIKQLVEQEVEKRQGDVDRVSKKIDSFANQLEPLLNKINTRVEFEQFLKDAIKLSSKNVKGQDILISVRRVLQQLQKELK
tara:strand:- start:411 stop:671 length:261 start_codon:yes stop_codon:yes gene_type:complete